jgi:hypothetical protein
MKRFSTLLALALALAGLSLPLLMAAPCWGAAGTVVTVSGDSATYPTINPGHNGWYTAPLYGAGWWVRYENDRLTESWKDGITYTYQKGKWVKVVEGTTVETLPEPTENFGVDPTKIHVDPPGKFHKGKPINREEAMEIIESANLPDESKKLGYLVFIGPKEAAKSVAAELDKVPSLKSKVFFQAYETSDWPAEQYALSSSPKFKDVALFLQDLGGKVCHAQFEPVKAQDLQSVDQNWKPEAAPDLREKGIAQKAADWADENPMPCCAIAGGALLLLYRRKQQPVS